jgi:hypothetical protein
LGNFDVVVSHLIHHWNIHVWVGMEILHAVGRHFSMARAWCITKTGGKLYMRLPTGKDEVMLNMNWVYGKIRWPLVTANWQQIDGANHGEEEFLVNSTGKRIFGGTGFLFSKVEYS